MIRTNALPRPNIPRAEIAAALFAATLALIAVRQSTPAAPAPAASPLVWAIAEVEAAGAPRSASYYPEHLAALQSLSGFQPMADAGEKPATPLVPLAAPVKPAPFQLKTVRRAEAPKTNVAAVRPVAATVAAPVENRIGIFGVAMPTAADVGDRVAGLRDAAGHWGAAAAAGVGEKVTGLWR